MGLVAFGVAAATLVLTLTGIAVALGNASDRRVRELRVAGPQVKRLGSALLFGIGVWFVYLAAINPTNLVPA